MICYSIIATRGMVTSFSSMHAPVAVEVVYDAYPKPQLGIIARLDTDTFYVEVQTEGSADNVTLQARWTGPDGAVAGEASKTISPKGSTTTLLQAAPPKDKDARWPAGNYKLEILVNGNSQGTRDLSAR